MPREGLSSPVQSSPVQICTTVVPWPVRHREDLAASVQPIRRRAQIVIPPHIWLVCPPERLPYHATIVCWFFRWRCAVLCMPHSIFGAGSITYIWWSLCPRKAGWLFLIIPSIQDSVHGNALHTTLPRIAQPSPAETRPSEPRPRVEQAETHTVSVLLQTRRARPCVDFLETLETCQVGTRPRRPSPLWDPRGTGLRVGGPRRGRCAVAPSRYHPRPPRLRANLALLQRPAESDPGRPDGCQTTLVSR